MGINLSFEADAKIELHQCQSFDTNINILKILFFKIISVVSTSLLALRKYSVDK